MSLNVLRVGSLNGDLSKPLRGEVPSTNLVSDYTYDYLDRLTKYRAYSSGSVTKSGQYDYDALDRVSVETETHAGLADRTIGFSYRADTAEPTTEQLTRGTAQTTKDFTYDASDRMIGMASTSGGATTNYRYGYDPHGDVSMLLGDSGQANATYGYRSYGGSDSGLSRGDTNPDDPTNPYRFSADRLDSASDTIDMGARRYDADLGRFPQEDQLEEPDGDTQLGMDASTQNRYALAAANPINSIELDGHSTASLTGGSGVKRSKSYWNQARRVVERRWGIQPGNPIEHMGLMPVALRVGTVRHEAALLATVVAAMSHYPGARITADRRSNRVPGAGRLPHTPGFPDLIVHAYHGFFVYEIKPDNAYGRSSGLAQMNRYIRGLTREHPGRPVGRGDALPSRAIPAPPISEIITVRSGLQFSPYQGIEFYNHIPMLPIAQPEHKPWYVRDWKWVTGAAGAAVTVWLGAKIYSPGCAPLGGPIGVGVCAVVL